MFNTGCNPCGFSEQFLYNFPRIIEDIQETLLVIIIIYIETFELFTYNIKEAL